MADCIKDLLRATSTVPTGCEKSRLVLHLIEKEYNKHFDYIIMIWAMLWWIKTSHTKGWMNETEWQCLT